MNRPLEQIPQLESKRMSLGEDPLLSMESWLLKICVGCRNNDHEKYGTPQTCWNPNATEKRRASAYLCAQDEVVEVAFALSHHEAVKIAETPATALAALERQGRGEVRVVTLTPREREDLIKAKRREISSSSNMQRWRQLRGLDCIATA